MLFSFLIDIFFPRLCLACKTEGPWLCDFCFSLIQLNSNQCCYMCRKQNRDGRTCSRHFCIDAIHRVSLLDGLIVAAHYDGNPILKKAIRELKFHGRREGIVEKLGKLLSKTLHSFFVLRFSFCLIPVPLHPNRLKKRGFNQAELLAKEILSELPSLHFQLLLIRTRDTPSQVECRDRQTRLENPKGAFAMNGEIDPNQTYILVDDLATTGATMEECCRTLKANGAKTVWGLVLARN